MILVKTIPHLRKIIQKAKKGGKKISFVPTMGALHEGHLSLIKAAKKEKGLVVVSIFVNPAQFGPKEDFKTYPRHIKQDVKLLKDCHVDVLFTPSVKSIYPEGFSTYVDEEYLSKKMCGIFRLGHFRGVTTVVMKLFNMVQPDIAFFGKKDYQQLLIIKKMIKDLDMPIKIKAMPTIRERDGLAMSSRNKYLSKKERETALGIYKTLKRKKMKKIIKGVKLDYFIAVDKNTLEPVKKIKKGTLLAIAGWVGKTRLIDNIIV